VGKDNSDTRNESKGPHTILREENPISFFPDEFAARENRAHNNSQR
jgi:hypothetical protein